MDGFKFNKDQAARDKLLGISPEAKYLGGIEAYEGLKAVTLQTLIELDFADPEDAQNSAPTIGEFLEFMEAHPNFRANGYAVSDKRDDYRVSIEGLRSAGKVTAKDKRDFIQAFRQADEFSITGGRCFCWYD